MDIDSDFNPAKVRGDLFREAVKLRADHACMSIAPTSGDYHQRKIS